MAKRKDIPPVPISGSADTSEVAPVLSGNPSEAQIHDKPLNETCPVVVPAEVIVISDDSSDGESIGSHSSEKQTADAMVKTEPIMENDVTVDTATLLSEPIGVISDDSSDGELLEGKNPVCKSRSESTPRQRKRPNFFNDSCGVNNRRKTVKNVVEGETGRSNEGVPVQNESTAVGNEENVHELLKPTVSELCKILKFSENVTTIVESFLKFVIENFQVFKKHTSILQALMISVCWIGSSLSKYMIDMIDREQSFGLAKKQLNFICSKEEADQVYEKLQSVKETFLQNTKDLEIVNNIEECTMPHQEPRMSNSVPLNPQESKPENCDSSNEETLQSTKQILKEDLARKDENEIDKFNRVWEEKRMQIENECEVDKALLCYLHPSKSSKRSEMLKSVEEKFTNKLNEFHSTFVLTF